MHMVFYKIDPENDEWIWVMIVNPIDVSNRKDATIPDITVTIDDDSYILHEVVKLLVSKN